jgi:hypothetical protein
MLKFLMREHMSLGNCLEGVQVRAAFVVYKEHISRTSFSKDTHHLKVAYLHFTGDMLLDTCCRFGAFLAHPTLKGCIDQGSSSIAEAEIEAVSLPLS